MIEQHTISGSLGEAFVHHQATCSVFVLVVLAENVTLSLFENFVTVFNLSRLQNYFVPAKNKTKRGTEVLALWVTACAMLSLSPQHPHKIWA